MWLPPKVESCGLGIDELREEGGECHLVTELNECWLGAIRLLLLGQSSADLSAFDIMVEDHRAQGHELTSLVAELRYPARERVTRKWTCNGRSKSAAKSRKEDL